MLPKISFTAAGDAVISKRLTDYEGFIQIYDEINKGDVRFFNLETTIHDYESFASQFSGGGWLCAPKECLRDCVDFGFNMASLANNHTLDFSYGGLEKTLENVRDTPLCCAGAGHNLEQASAPVYLDCPQGRIALIAITSSFHPAAMAGEQNRSLLGRPGVNYLRHSTIHCLQPRYIEMLKELSEKSGVNNLREFLRSAGYLPALSPGKYEFDNLVFMESAENEVKTFCNKQDLERVKNEIYEAQLQADYILISLHSHELNGKSWTVPPQFVEEFCKFCIDNGAHAVIGHGPHVLRPIEIYRNRPIFYSLGDFIFHNENMTKAPADFCQSAGMDPNSRVRDVLAARSRNFTVGWQNTPEAFQSVIPYWEMEDGALTKLSLLAIELDYESSRTKGGWPKPAADPSILTRLAEISESWGTKMAVHGNRADIILQ